LRPGRWLPGWANRQSAPSEVTGTSPTPAKWILAASRLIAVFTALAVVGMLAIAITGYGSARQSDEQLLRGQHAALRNTIAEFRQPLERSGAIDPRLLRMAEYIPGLKNLKFETDPSTRDRELQPVMDSAGRTAGFFTWDRSRPMAQVVGWFASFFAAVAVVLFGIAAFGSLSARGAGSGSRPCGR
jgi:hypothetical protein